MKSTRNKKAYGDAEKIKSCLSELVENSLKHNPDVAHLEISIESKDVESLPAHIVSPMKAQTRKMLAKKNTSLLLLAIMAKVFPINKKTGYFYP